MWWIQDAITSAWNCIQANLLTRHLFISFLIFSFWFLQLLCNEIRCELTEANRTSQQKFPRMDDYKEITELHDAERCSQRLSTHFSWAPVPFICVVKSWQLWIKRLWRDDDLSRACKSCGRAPTTMDIVIISPARHQIWADCDATLMLKHGDSARILMWNTFAR